MFFLFDAWTYANRILLRCFTVNTGWLFILHEPGTISQTPLKPGPTIILPETNTNTYEIMYDSDSTDLRKITRKKNRIKKKIM